MLLRGLLVTLALLLAPSAFAAVATIYIDTGGCESGSTTKCSGTTDSASASAKGASSTITCSAVSGVGGAPGCTITGTETAVGQLGSINTDGSQALFVNCATNTNQKIFFLTAVDNATGAISTSVTPTGCTAATSDWGIGGRRIFPSGLTDEAVFTAALRAGDTVQFNNTPATKTVTYFTPTTSGSAAAGKIKFIGKAGVDHPVLEISSGDTKSIFALVTETDILIQNLELKCVNTSNACVFQGGARITINDVKFTGTGAGGIAIKPNGGAWIIMNSQFTSGVLGDAINTAFSQSVLGNYFNGVGGDCYEDTAADPSPLILNNLFVSCGGRAILLSGASTTGSLPRIFSNTIYGSGASGLDATDGQTTVYMANNIFQENGNAATEFNVKLATGVSLTLVNYNNLYFHSNCEGSASSATCVSGFTPNATEVAGSSALFTSAGTDFTLLSTSPAKAMGFPGQMLGGSVNIGYLDMGSLQRLEPVGSGGRCIGC